MNAIRLIGWLIFGVILPLVTLVSVPFFTYLNSSTTDSLLSAVQTAHTYEDLVAIAFTLSAASAIDALITGWGKYTVSLICGIFTIFITLLIMLLYSYAKPINDTPHSPHEHLAIVLEVSAYLIAVFLSVCCEICAVVAG
jgi:hypothetical protein